MCSPEWRAVDLGDRQIRARTLPNGDVLVSIVSGAFTAVASVPVASVAFLFGNNPSNEQEPA